MHPQTLVTKLTQFNWNPFCELLIWTTSSDWNKPHPQEVQAKSLQAVPCVFTYNGACMFLLYLFSFILCRALHTRTCYGHLIKILWLMWLWQPIWLGFTPSFYFFTNPMYRHFWSQWSIIHILWSKYIYKVKVYLKFRYICVKVTSIYR